MRGQRVLIIGLCVAVPMLGLVPVSGASTSGAKGRFCGASKCVTIPAALATALSQRNDSFQPASIPKPAPFYRITITATGEGFINRTIIWVPSRKLWYLKEYVTPTLPGYWRTENAETDAGLGRLVKMARPFAAPKHWVLPK